MTIETIMFKERFDSLPKYYDEKKIRVISIENDFVKFEITVSDGVDIIEIFSAGVSYGINMGIPKAV